VLLVAFLRLIDILLLKWTRGVTRRKRSQLSTTKVVRKGAVQVAPAIANVLDFRIHCGQKHVDCTAAAPKPKPSPGVLGSCVTTTAEVVALLEQLS
jgi:hypothetical protein